MTEEEEKHYTEYIKSKEWKTTRKTVLLFRGNSCEYCGSNKNTDVRLMNVKHAGEELDEDVLVLCDTCFSPAK